MKKFTIGYDPINKHYLISNSPSGYFDGDAIRFKDDQDLIKNLRNFITSQEADRRVIGLIPESTSSKTEETSRLIDIIRSINPKTVRLQ